MIKVNDVQAAFIAWLKSQVSVTALLVSPSSSQEIREMEWQGSDHHYPNIRVSTTLQPNQCAPHDLDIRVVIASEEKSSKQANSITAAIVDLVQEKSFSQGVIPIRFMGLKVLDIPKAERSPENIWEADINIVGMVS